MIFATEKNETVSCILKFRVYTLLKSIVVMILNYTTVASDKIIMLMNV